MTASPPRDSASFEVREALREPGCTVCRLSLRSVTRFIQSIAYEQVNDVGLRKELRRARGFCNVHAYQWLREARSVLGTALIYRDVLRTALLDLESGAPAGGLRGLLGAPAPHRTRYGPCPVCRVQTEAESRYLETLLGLVATDEEIRSLSPELCRRHVVAGLRSRRDGAEYVAIRAREAVEALVHELDEVIRKEDYRFRHEARTDAERTAPARAVAWAAGAEGIVPT